MFLIIPSPKEASDWSFHEPSPSCWIGIPCGGGAAIKVERASNDSSGWNYVSSKLSSAIFLVLNPIARLPTLIVPEIPANVAKQFNKAFVHFGDTNKDQMSLDWIREKWGTLTTDLKLPQIEDKIVMPMSVSGGLEWRANIIKFRNVCKPQEAISNDALTSLEDAYEMAWGYFYRRLTFQRACEALFPVYLTLAQTDINNEDLNAALKAAQKTIESTDFRDVKNGLQGNSLELKAEFLGENTDNFIANSFLCWFQKVSKAYSEEFGMARKPLQQP